MNGVNCKQLIKNFQKNQDSRSEKIILEKYYFDACKYAYKYLNNNTYSNMLSYNKKEVNSYVYIAFTKALKGYKLDQENCLSFKNYFYQMIKYETLNEMKNTFNWQIIPNYQVHIKNFNIDMQKIEEKNVLEILDIKQKIDVVYNFLLTKNLLYAKIWKLKSEGFDKRDICQKLNLTPEEVKSKYQYIKKLILNKYLNTDNIF